MDFKSNEKYANHYSITSYPDFFVLNNFAKVYYKNPIQGEFTSEKVSQFLTDVASEKIQVTFTTALL